MADSIVRIIVNGEDNASGMLGKLGGVLKGGLVVGAAAAVAGIAGLGAALKSSVSEAEAAEEVTAQLNAVLKSTKGIAGMTADAINDQAQALSEVTRFEDDAIVSASSLLLTFTKVGKDVFPQATEATLDMATAMKMDLRSATMLVGKALNDPLLGLTALTRSGIQFTEGQKDMIEAMVEAGDVAGAQRLILAELETQFGGSARAAGETATGMRDILGNALGNVKEEIGGALLPLIKDLTLWIGTRLVRGLRSFSDWFRTSVEDMREFVAKAGKAKGIISGIIDDVTAGKKINWQDLMNLSGLFTNELDVQRAFGRIVKDIEEGVLRIKSAFDEGGVLGALGEIGAMIGEGFAKVDWEAIKNDLVSGATNWWTNSLLPALGSIDWPSIGIAMQTAWDTLSTFWETEAIPFATQVANSISTWFTGQVIPVLKAQAPAWGAKLAEVLKSMITINGMVIGEDANLAYVLGAGFVKLLGESLKALSVGPMMLFNAFKSVDWAATFSGDANLGEIFGDIFGPVGDFLMGALDALLLELAGGAAARISAWWAGIWASITGTTSGGTPHDPGSYVGPSAPTPPTSGRMASGNPLGEAATAYGRWIDQMNGLFAGITAGATAAPWMPVITGIPNAGREMTPGMVVYQTINVLGGNPQVVGREAEQGVLRAARAMGLR